MEQLFTVTIPQVIADRSVVTMLAVFLGGLLTSISPCVVAMTPVMVSYIGGYGQENKSKGFILSFSFVAGLATTFALLGSIAAYFGLIFGQIGAGWYYLLAGVALVMGLHLLGAISINFPGLKKMPIKAKGSGGSFLMGLLFGLVASPCATPVLAVIITYVAVQGEPLYGSLLLLIYGFGHGIPLLIAGTFTSLIAGLGKIQRYSRYLNYVSGSVLILFGLYLLAWISW